MSKKDRMWVGPEFPDGNRPYIRDREEGPQAGLMGDDVPTPDSVVELKHLDGCCYEVTSEVKLTSTGPAKVSNRAYRSGWDRIFGGKAPVGQA